MKKRPNPFWHMMAWGMSSGAILAMSYIVIVLDFFGGTGGELWEILLNPGGWWLALMFGGVPGAIMGFFCGLTLWGILRKAPIPFTKADMTEKRRAVYGSIFSLTLILSILMMLPLFGTFFEVPILWLPPLVAASAATYVAHRYMYRLRVWSGGMESRKTKAKNEALSRLSDNFVEDVNSDTESAVEKQDYLR